MSTYRMIRSVGLLFTALVLVTLSTGCHRDRDLKICEYNPGYCSDGGDADSLDGDAAVDETSADSEADSASDSGSDDASVDSGSVDSSSSESSADTALGDSSPTDSGSTDSGLVDSGPTDTCTCASGTNEVVSGGSCPAGDSYQRTCTACTWSLPKCVTPKGWRTIALPPTAFVGRDSHTLVWTGTEMIAFGGERWTAAPALEYRADGAAYNLATDTWRTLPDYPLGRRSGHSAVWTGTRMIVWGGSDGSALTNTGAAYDPGAGTWTTIKASPLSARRFHAAAWSAATGQMLIWGGEGTSSAFADGAAYSPATDTWTALPAAPITGRSPRLGCMIGSSFAVWGGGYSADEKNGAFYDPVAKTWSYITPAPGTVDSWDSVWAAGPDELFLWGGSVSSAYSTTACATRLAAAGPPSLRPPL